MDKEWDNQKGRVKYYRLFPKMNNKKENRYDRAYKNEETVVKNKTPTLK